MLVKALREGLGRLVVFVDYISRPKPTQRSDDEQEMAEAAASHLSLYQFYACPFCVRTRRVIHRLNLPIEYRDAQRPGPHRSDLEQGGGTVQVPCLRIDENGETRWLYESEVIIEYLSQRFDPEFAATRDTAKQAS